MTTLKKTWAIETSKMKVNFSESEYIGHVVEILNKETGEKILTTIKSSIEEYAKSGGTAVFCPSCNKIRVCEAINPSDLGKIGDRRRYMTEHKDVQWFRRGRRCRTCFYKFITAEIHEDFLFELVLLRNEMIKAKDLSPEQLIQYGENIIPFPIAPKSSPL